MTKTEFLNQLKGRLKGLPREDIEKSIEYYSEMIDDRVEDGLSEEEAISELGSLDEIVSQILKETPLTRIVKEKVRPKHRLRFWEILLIILGAPVWVPLLFAAVTVFITIYVVIWTVIAVFYAVDLVFAACSICCFIFSFLCISGAGLPVALLSFGASLILAGLAAVSFIGVTKVAYLMLILSKKILLGTKSMFVGGKENEKIS